MCSNSEAHLRALGCKQRLSGLKSVDAHHWLLCVASNCLTIPQQWPAVPSHAQGRTGACPTRLLCSTRSRWFWHLCRLNVAQRR